MKPILLVTLFALCAYTSRAQAPVVSKALPEFTLGIKFGGNYEELSGSSVFEKGYDAGYVGGAYAALVKNKIGLQVEALVSSAKINYRPTGCLCGFIAPPTNAKMHYVNFPVLFEYKLVQHLWLQAGPQFSDLIDIKNNQGNDIRNGFKRLDAGGVLGLQATLPLHFNISARYILGLTNVVNVTGYGVWNTRSIQVTGGYSFL